MRAAPRDELLGEAAHLLHFAAGARLSQGGFGWLDAAGRPQPDHPRPLYVTCRMTHVFALGVLAGHEASTALVDHGLEALRGAFRDPVHGGWYTALAADGPEPADARKWAYPHAFVALAASSATLAGRPGAADLLAEALDVLEQRFWDSRHAMLVEEWDRGFTELSSYRGANAAMHGVEAMLAAAEVTGEDVWADRAADVVARMVGQARNHAWRLPEHYDEAWAPVRDFHADRREDPFRPYGTTPGHALQWARLLLHLEAVRPGQHLAAARALFAVAMADAWQADGLPGLLYTVDFDGAPVIRQRLHWVLCEGIAAAAALWHRTGEEEYLSWVHRMWAHARSHHLDGELGSWHHELDPDQRPAARIRPGKADAYHALQACLLPLLPLRAGVAGALAEAGLRLPVEPADRVLGSARRSGPASTGGDVPRMMWSGFGDGCQQ